MSQERQDRSYQKSYDIQYLHIYVHVVKMQTRHAAAQDTCMHFYIVQTFLLSLGKTKKNKSKARTSQ